MKFLEKHHFKITAIIFIITVISMLMLINFSTWKINQEKEHRELFLRQNNLSVDFSIIKEELISLENKQNDTDLTMAKICTKLVNIETLLLDIRENINEEE